MIKLQLTTLSEIGKGKTESKSFSTVVAASEYAIRSIGNNAKVGGDLAVSSDNKKQLRLLSAEAQWPFDLSQNKVIHTAVTPSLQDLVNGGDKWGKYRAQAEAYAKYAKEANAKNKKIHDKEYDARLARDPKERAKVEDVKSMLKERAQRTKAGSEFTGPLNQHETWDRENAEFRAEAKKIKAMGWRVGQKARLLKGPDRQVGGEGVIVELGPKSVKIKTEAGKTVMGYYNYLRAM
jgi:hypothetical protein